MARLGEVQQQSKGANQHRALPAIKQWPHMPELIQEYLYKHTSQKLILRYLQDDHGIEISLRTLQRLIKDKDLQTTRRSGHSDEEKAAAIIDFVEDEDPLGRVGARQMREKLALKRGVMVSRDFITKFLGIYKPEANLARHPTSKATHANGLWSAGSNEEWNVDGHEKILESMGIAIWGGVDKWSRMEIGLWAVPDARVVTVPPSCFLLMAKKKGGVPLQLVSDKGSETGILAALQTSLRTAYMPDLDPAEVPPHRFLTSTKNITRERNWRPLHDKELSNIKYMWQTGKANVGFSPTNEIHVGISQWLWAKIVQARLDDYVVESENHFVRHQAKTLLPSGGRHIDFYRRPEEWGGINCLIEVPGDALDRLIAEHYDPSVFQFGTDDMVHLCEDLYAAVGAPQPVACKGWAIFRAMLDTYIQRVQYSSV